jgi:hypothetical protein
LAGALVAALAGALAGVRSDVAVAALVAASVSVLVADRAFLPSDLGVSDFVLADFVPDFGLETTDDLSPDAPRP